MTVQHEPLGCELLRISSSKRRLRAPQVKRPKLANALQDLHTLVSGAELQP